MSKTLEIDFDSLTTDTANCMMKSDYYEKVAVKNCPSIAEAIQLLNQLTFYKNQSSIGIVLNIDEELNENQRHQVHSIFYDPEAPHHLLIAFKSNVDGKLIVYWKTQSMSCFLSTKLERFQINEKSFMPVPDDVLIDSFQLLSIINGHNCKNKLTLVII
jgi:hypothetical protein